MDDETNREKLSLRNEAWLALVYFFAYLGYLFIHLEGELGHWLSLLVLPFLLVHGYRRLTSVAPNLGSTLKSFGLSKGNLTNGLLWGVLLGLGLSILQFSLSRYSQQIIELIRTGKALYLFPISVLLMLLTAGLTEEFFFRGFLQGRLESLLRSKIAGVLLSSFLFGIYHLPYAYLNPRWPSHGNWKAALALSLGQGVPAGLILGTLYARKRNLLACIALHSLINSLPAMTMIKFKG